MNILPYIDLSAKIRAAVEGIKDIDLYNGQYEKPRTEDPFNTPAVFIEYLDGENEDMAGAVQLFNGGICLHVVESTYRRTRNIDQKSQQDQDKNLAHLKTDDLVHKAVHHLIPEGCKSPMVRIRTDYDQNHDQLMVTRFYYHTIIEDPKEIETTMVENVELSNGISFEIEE
jgi:hypothetical protein